MRWKAKMAITKIMLSLNVYTFTLKNDQGPVVQSIVSLTSSLRGQLVKSFRTL